MDTHSVHISAAVDEVLALFQMQLPPISMRIFSLTLKWVITTEEFPIVNIKNIQSEPEVEEMEFNGNPFEFNPFLTKASFEIMAETESKKHH